MPRRTNDFQELIALINRQLAPAGAVVTESAIREDALTHHGREVDITIQHELAGYPITVIVECRDHDRPQDVTWIDALIGKYLHQVAHVVAVSSSGFTNQALDKAKAVGITTMAIEEARDTNWQKWVAAMKSIWVTLHGRTMTGIFNINLVDRTIKTPPSPPLMAGNKPGDVVFEQADGIQATAWDIFQNLSEAFVEEVIGRSDRQADGSIRFRYGLPNGTMLVLNDGTKLPADGIGYLLKEEVETIEVPLDAGEYGATSIATGSATGSAWKILIAHVRDKDGVPRMTLRATRLSGEPLEGRFTLYGVGEPVPPPK
jgi:restriction endonuclease